MAGMQQNAFAHSILAVAGRAAVCLWVFVWSAQSPAYTVAWTQTVTVPPPARELGPPVAQFCAGDIDVTNPALARDSAGDVFAVSCGADNGGAGAAFTVTKFDGGTGVIIWSRTIVENSPLYYSSVTNQVLLDPNEDLLVSSFYDSDEVQFAILAKFDRATGATLWTVPSGPPAALGVQADGNIRVSSTETRSRVDGSNVAATVSPLLVNRGSQPTVFGGTAYAVGVAANGKTRTVTKYQGIVPPGAPLLVNVESGNTIAKLTFNPPADAQAASVVRYQHACNTLTGGSTGSPGYVRDLINFATYQCTVQAVNVFGTPGPASNALSAGPAPYPFSLRSVSSRKRHADAGAFDLPIATGIPIDGGLTVEPRTFGGSHDIVFSFSEAVDFAWMDGVLVPNTFISFLAQFANGSPVAGSSLRVEGMEAIITLPAMADGSRVSLSLSGIASVLNPASPPIGANANIGFLVGNVTGSGAAGPDDLSATKANAGRAADGFSYRHDINLSGTVTAADIAVVKSRSGRTLH